VSKIQTFLRFVYDFIIGDDWTLAAGVVLALAATALVAHHGITAYWIVPVAVIALIGWSAARTSRP
jgi:hypothetical protein